MPTIIDSFLVTLGLDPSDFNRGAADQKKRLNDAKDDAKKHGDEIERSTKKQREGFSLLKGELLGLFGVIGGATALLAFITSTTKSDAAVGRLSHNIGESTETIGAWQGVLRGVGGTSEDAAHDLTVLASAAQEISLTGQSKLIPYLNLLHISLEDLKHPSDTLLKIADAFSTMDPRQAAKIGSDMGFSPAMISTLEKGRGAVTALLDEQRKLAPITQANADAAAEYERNMADVKTEVGGVARSLFSELAPSLIGVLKWFKETGSDPTFKDGMRAAGEVCKAVGTVIKGVFDIVGGVIRTVAQLLSGDFSGAWQTVKATVSDVVKDIAGLLGNVIKAALDFWDALRGKKRRAGGMGDSGADTMIAYGQGAYDKKPAAPVSRGAPAAPAAVGGDAFNRIVANFKARGYSDAAARGVAAGIGAESQYNEKAFNGTGGGQGAFGLGQWRGGRLRELHRRYGANPTFDQQLEYLAWELANSEKSHGMALQGAGNADQALGLYVNGVMRPGAAGAAGDMKRGRSLLASRGGNTTMASTTVTVGRIDVHTRATDAAGIARDISPALAKVVPQTNLGTS